MLLSECEITVLNYNQFSPLVTLIIDYFFSCYDSSSILESSTKFSGLPHVTDPQSHDGMHIVLFYLHLHLLVVQVLQVHCNNSVHILGRGSNSKNFGFN